MKQIPRSQKAAGVMALQQHCSGHGNFHTPFNRLYQSEADIEADMFMPGFGRPCPVRPRHGFVESRMVQDRAELAALFAEARAADPEAEVMVMAKIDAICSAVLTTSGNLTCGPGHDGATGGKNSFTLNLPPLILSSELLQAARITETGYLELVADATRTWTVQLRNGPAVPAVADFIPKDVVVQFVVAPSDDLLAWEAATAAFVTGTVVYAPGAGLTSHAAVHCILNNVPFVTTFEPFVGQTLAACTEAVAEVRTEDFRRGFHVGMNVKLSPANQKEMAQVPFLVLHSWSALRTSRNSGFWLGAACALLARFAAVLGYGEARYSATSGCGCEPSLLPPKLRHALAARKDGHGVMNKQTRWAVYKRMYSKRAGAVWQMEQLCEAFGASSNSNYGGVKWANCTRIGQQLLKHSVDIYNGVQFSSNDTPGQVSTQLLGYVLSALNQAVNAAHNGGFWFNKILSESTMNLLSTAPALQATKILLQLWQLRQAGVTLARVPVRLRRKVSVPYEYPVEDSSDDEEVQEEQEEQEEAAPPEPEPELVTDVFNVTGNLARVQVRSLGQNKVRFQFSMEGQGPKWVEMDANLPFNPGLLECDVRSLAGTNKKYAALVETENGWRCEGASWYLKQNGLVCTFMQDTEQKEINLESLPL